MKTSAVIVSLLFGSFAVAAPVVNKRHVVTSTEVITETQTMYTTIYGDEPVPSTAGGAYSEQPQPSTTAAEVKPTSSAAPAYTPSSQVVQPSSVYTPSPQAPSSTPTPTPSPVAVQSSAAPSPVAVSSSAAPVAAAAASSSAAPAPSASAAPSTGSATGSTYSGDITIYNSEGGYGACGTQLADTDMTVALSHVAWGASTYNTATGAATNPWCGQKVQITYGSNAPVIATIMDMCPGCSGDDLDLLPAVWDAVTGSTVETRYKATWVKVD